MIFLIGNSGAINRNKWGFCGSIEAAMAALIVTHPILLRMHREAIEWRTHHTLSNKEKKNNNKQNEWMKRIMRGCSNSPLVNYAYFSLSPFALLFTASYKHESFASFMAFLISFFMLSYQRQILRRQTKKKTNNANAFINKFKFNCFYIQSQCMNT